MMRQTPTFTLFPYTTLFRSRRGRPHRHLRARDGDDPLRPARPREPRRPEPRPPRASRALVSHHGGRRGDGHPPGLAGQRQAGRRQARRRQARRRGRARPPTRLRGHHDRAAQRPGRHPARPGDLRWQHGRRGDVPAVPAGSSRLDRAGRPDQRPDGDGAAEGRMSGGPVRILEGNTFVVSDDRGDIEASASDPAGLFSFDTRFLSRWVLTVNGQRLTALSTDDLQYFQTRFFLVPGLRTVYVNATLTVIRLREVADGFHEELRVLNHANDPVDLRIRVEAASDFADLFEVKDAVAKRGRYEARVAGGSLVLAYRRESYVRETWIGSSEPAAVDEHGLSFTVTVPPHGEWATVLDVVASAAAAQGSPAGHAGVPVVAGRRRVRRDMARGLEKWLERAPDLRCDWEPLEQIYRRCLTDLAALRFSTPTMPGRSLPAAGLPWFMTMFGRDSIFTSLQALPFTAELAATTLRALAERQGTRIDDFRDEDPGRILHEMRYGELTAFEERPHSPYYGSADATPLF